MANLYLTKIVAVACIVGVSLLAAHTSADSASKPATRPYLEKPTDATSEEWQKLSKTLLDKYKLPEDLRHDVLLLRAAQMWTLLDSEKWTTVDAIPAGVHFANPPKAGGARQWLKHSPSGGYMAIRLWIEPNATAAFGQCALISARQLGNAARPSTWYGRVNPLSITGWDFAAHFNDAPSNRLFASSGNVWISVQMAGEEVSKHASLAEVAALCEKLTFLMDGTAKADEPRRRASAEQLSLQVVEHKDGMAVISWDTPEKGKLDKHWVKVRTSSGRLSISQDGKIELAGVSPKGATVTCYAISPDGKEWYSASVEIPGRPAASQPDAITPHPQPHPGGPGQPGTPHDHPAAEIKFPVSRSRPAAVAHGPRQSLTACGPPAEHENGGESRGVMAVRWGEVWGVVTLRSIPALIDSDRAGPGGKQADLQWCFQPVYQSGPDIASNLRLLPAFVAEHAVQIAVTFDVHRRRAAK